MTRRPSLLFLLMLSVFAAAGGRAEGEAKPPAGPQPAQNLLLISIDTLRADRLGSYGYQRPTSPALDVLAQRGVRFDPAIAESNWTLPSHMTLMTGLHPSSHGVTDDGKRLPKSTRTLAEVLRRHGYRTFAVTAGGFMRRGHGFARGFESYRARKDKLRKTLFFARKALDSVQDGERFFLFVHTFDVHCPYDAPEPYATMFRTGLPKDAFELPDGCQDKKLSRMRMRPGQIKFLSDLYDAGIRATDDTLGAFLRDMEELGRLSNTIVIVVSDHGEEFKEHGAVGHGRNLYIGSLRIPLIIVAPGVPPGVIRSGAGLVDVLPTVLEMLHLPSPPVQGESLLPQMLDGDSSHPPRPLFSESERARRLRSVVQGRMHLIFEKKRQRFRLFDWVSDPRELSPLSPSNSPEGTRLMKVLHDHQAAAVHSPTETAPTPTADEREQLRALGYVED